MEGERFERPPRLDEAAVDLDFIIARRAPEDPGNGVIFVSPLQGDREIRAASTLGFAISGSIAAVRVEGENEPGAAARLTDLIAGADINMRGFSGAVVGGRYIAYIGFDSPGDAGRDLSQTTIVDLAHHCRGAVAGGQVHTRREHGR